MSVTRLALPACLSALVLAAASPASAGGTAGVMELTGGGKGITKNVVVNLTSLIASEVDIQGGYDFSMQHGAGEFSNGCPSDAGCVKSFGASKKYVHVYAGSVTSDDGQTLRLKLRLFDVAAGKVKREVSRDLPAAADKLVDLIPAVVREAVTGKAAADEKAPAVAQKTQVAPVLTITEDDLFGDDEEGKSRKQPKSSPPPASTAAREDEEDEDPLGIEGKVRPEDVARDDDEDEEKAPARGRGGKAVAEEEDSGEDEVDAKLAAEERAEERRIEQERTRREEEERSKREAADRARREEEARVAAKRAEEERVRREAEDKARREEEARVAAKRAEEERVRRDAEDKARREEDARLAARRAEEERTAARQAEEDRARRQAEQERQAKASSSPAGTDIEISSTRDEIVIGAAGDDDEEEDEGDSGYVRSSGPGRSGSEDSGYARTSPAASSDRSSDRSSDDESGYARASSGAEDSGYTRASPSSGSASRSAADDDSGYSRGASSSRSADDEDSGYSRTASSSSYDDDEDPPARRRGSSEDEDDGYSSSYSDDDEDRGRGRSDTRSSGRVRDLDDEPSGRSRTSRRGSSRTDHVAIKGNVGGLYFFRGMFAAHLGVGIHLHRNVLLNIGYSPAFTSDEVNGEAESMFLPIVQLGVQVKGPQGRVRPFVGLDGLVIVYMGDDPETEGTDPQVAPGGQISGGADFMVTDLFGFYVSGNAGVAHAGRVQRIPEFAEAKSTTFVGGGGAGIVLSF